MEMMDDETVRRVEGTSEKSLSEQLKDHWATMSEEEIRKEMDEIEMHMHDIDPDEMDSKKKLDRIRRKQKMQDILSTIGYAVSLIIVPASLLVLAFSSSITVKLLALAAGLVTYAVIIRGYEKRY